MIIKCEKCNKDIKKTIYKEIETNTPKTIICPECHYEQKRYISEADLQVYLAYMETAYFILSFITAIMINYIGINIFVGIIFILLFALSIYVTNLFKANLYLNPRYKKETMYIKMQEDGKTISRGLRWQFILFFALVITFVTEYNYPALFWGFVLLSILAIVLSFIKAKLAIKKEKEKYLNK